LILRALGGGQGLDVEAVEQGPGPEGLGGQGLVDAVEIVVRGLGLRNWVKPNTWLNTWLSHSHDGVPRNRWKFWASSRQASRGSVPGTPALERTFRASRLIPWL
jgi:hypothetical protein